MFWKSLENIFYNSSIIHHYNKLFSVRKLSPLTPAAGSARHVQFLSNFHSVVSITVTSISQCHSNCCQQSTGEWHTSISALQLTPDQRHVRTKSAWKVRRFHMKCFIRKVNWHWHIHDRVASSTVSKSD